MQNFLVCSKIKFQGVKIVDDQLTKEGISAYLKCKNINLEFFETIDSTNLYLKKKDIDSTPEFTVVIAQSQTAGRGRFDRKFHSPKNSGIYMSILLKPALPPEKSVLITALAAVAVSEAVEKLSGKNADIKWVNDILIEGKKVCGILSEAAIGADGKMSRVVLGIGINAYVPEDDFHEEIKNIAGAVYDAPQTDGRNRLAAEIINNVIKYYGELAQKTFLEKYKQKSIALGKNVRVMNTEEGTAARVLEIDDNCRLLVEYESGEKEYISSGEISIKL